MMHSRKVIIARPSCICVYVPSREFVPADPAANAATRALNTDRRVSGVTVMHFLLSNSGAAACPIATGKAFLKDRNVANAQQFLQAQAGDRKPPMWRDS